MTTTAIRKASIASKAFLDILIITAYITQNTVEEFNGFQDRRQQSKGGTGKTTISVNIAAAFEAGGNKVALIDADPQGTSVRWVTSGENTLPMTVLSLAPAGRGIGAEIKKQDANFDVIVVDCPGNLEDPRIASVLEVADFCLVPLSPSPADLYSTVAMIRMIESMRSVRNPNLSSALMLNSVNGKLKCVKKF